MFKAPNAVVDPTGYSHDAPGAGAPSGDRPHQVDECLRPSIVGCGSFVPVEHMTVRGHDGASHVRAPEVDGKGGIHGC